VLSRAHILSVECAVELLYTGCDLGIRRTCSDSGRVFDHIYHYGKIIQNGSSEVSLFRIPAILFFIFIHPEPVGGIALSGFVYGGRDAGGGSTPTTNLRIHRTVRNTKRKGN